MSYYDYDYEAEPNYPEVEEIIDEASGKFDEFLRSTFVAEYKNIQVANENNVVIEKQLNERSMSLDERERRLKEREAELNKSEKEQYEKLKSKWFNELGISFDIGETVYYVKDITSQIQCKTCGGAKTVTATIGGNELEIECPTCKGYGKQTGEKEYEVVEATITEINARLRKRQNGSVEIVEYSGYSYELVTYCYVTDVADRRGGARNISSKELYKTKEEAKAAIKELLKKD